MPTIDYYSQIETALANILKTLTVYLPNDFQIMNGDESGLAKGADYFIRLHPDVFSDTSVASQQAYVDWSVELKGYVRFKELQASWNGFRAFRSEIFWTVLQYPTLNNVPGVSSVRIGAADSPVYIVDNPEVANPTPLFISQTFIVTVHQKIAITGGEYA